MTTFGPRLKTGLTCRQRILRALARAPHTSAQLRAGIPCAASLLVALKRDGLIEVVDLAYRLTDAGRKVADAVV